MNIRCRSILAAWGLSLMSLAAQADIFTKVEERPVEELWLNPGIYSYHFQRDKHLNNDNFGLGAEYRYSTVSAVTAGIYHNSNRLTSHYVGYYWRPVTVGGMQLGAVLGALDGYPTARHGGWFPAAIPALSAESGRIGINILLIPTIKDWIYGSLSFQLRVKLY